MLKMQVLTWMGFPQQLALTKLMASQLSSSWGKFCSTTDLLWKKLKILVHEPAVSCFCSPCTLLIMSWKCLFRFLYRLRKNRRWTAGVGKGRPFWPSVLCSSRWARPTLLETMHQNAAAPGATGDADPKDPQNHSAQECDWTKFYQKYQNFCDWTKSIGKVKKNNVYKTSVKKVI